MLMICTQQLIDGGLMKYKQVVEGRFIQRLNRFVAEVEVDGSIQKVHVRNTGRCKELFIEGARVFLEPSDKPERKTKYSLVALYKGDLLINIDSQIPNYVAKEALTRNKDLMEILGNISYVKSEVTYGSSRFDLYYENQEKGCKGFIEVKGVTLEENGYSRFPDAPTSRGLKHLKELIKSVEEGYKSYVLFVIQMKHVKAFSPNTVTDPKFSKCLYEAKEAGVGVLCFDAVIEHDSIVLDKPVKLVL